MTQPTLGASNLAQLTWKLEGTYPNNFGVLQGGNGTKLNMTSESLDYQVKTEQSKQLNSSRLVQDIVQVGASSAGGFGFEAQYREYDPFIEGVLQSSFTAYGTNGVSAAMTGTLTMTSTTVLTDSIATSGADDMSTLSKGAWVGIIPKSTESAAVRAYFAGRAFRLSSSVSPTTTVLTLDAATPVDTSIVTAPLVAGWKLTSSVLKNGNTMKSYSLEVQHTDIGQFRQYLGMIPSKMDLKLSDGNIVTGSFEFMGKTFALKQATGMGSAAAAQTYTPANATRGVFDIFENGVSVSANTFIKSLDLSIDNSLRIQTAVGVFGAAGIGAGTMKNTAKLEVYFSNEVLYNRILAGSASSLTVPILDVDGNGYVYYFPRIKYTAAKVGTGGQDQDLTLAVDVEALPDITAGSPTLGYAVVIYRIGV